MLLQNKADLSILDDDGMTPLHKAAEQNHFQTLQVMILSGGKNLLFIRDKNGRTVLDCITDSQMKKDLEISLST